MEERLTGVPLIKKEKIMSNLENQTGITLSDEAIAHVAKILQVALLTGTDIVDNLRLARFENRDGQLFLTEDSVENFNNNLQRLMEEIPQSDSPFSKQENSPFSS